MERPMATVAEIFSTVLGLAAAYCWRHSYLSDEFGAIRTLLTFLLVWFGAAAIIYLILLIGAHVISALG
jgi:hypothetical protein